MRKVAGVLAAAAALAVGGAAQALPPSTASTSSDVLAQARQQTAQARTMLIGMTTSIRQGSRSVTVRATGSEVPARHLASLDMDLSQVSPMLGMEKVLMVGSSSYVHLPVLSTPAARTKGIKPWIVQDSSSAIGVDGWSLGGTGSAQALDDVRPAGSGVDDGIPVTRYTATIALRQALAASPQFQKLIGGAHAPASLLDTLITVRYDIDESGYLRQIAEAFSLRLPGRSPLAYRVDFTLGGFDEAVKPIIAPPPYDVMTMTEFRHATGTALPFA